MTMRRSAVIWLLVASSVQALDDKINHWETRVRRRQTALAPPSTAVMPAPTDAMVLITGELRFRDAEAADALKKRLSNVTVTIVCTWRRFASVALSGCLSKVGRPVSDGCRQCVNCVGFQAPDSLCTRLR